MTTRRTALLASAGSVALAVAIPFSGSASADPSAAAADEITMSRTAQSLSTTLGEDFGGSWLADGRLVVGVTDAARTGEVTGAGAVAKVVAHSSTELDSMVADMNAAEAKAPDSVTVWGVDVRNNAVNMTVLPGAVAEGRAFAATVGVTDVRITESAEVPRLFADIQGGEAYNIGSSRCSVGFSVSGGFVTAGHCEALTGGGALAKDGVALGSWGGSQFPGADYAWVQTSGDWNPVGQVSGVGAVAGSQEAATGAGVSKSGSTTGVTQGTIGAKNQTVNYPQGSVSGLTATDALCQPGDSGGAFISDGQAQGVVSGGNSATCYFQPVNPILSAYGLSLVTG
ncbi:MAG: S1 family peptidase [Actinophytocola sp.]|uniref:S1 family peptidase n=1 Tax=Actinophytocola sp. TaxID=1872138 RepID=UPI003C78E15D